MALADPGFAPYDGAEPALAVARFSGQGNKPFKRRLMDPIDVDFIRRRTVHAIVGEGIRRKHTGKEIIQLEHRLSLATTSGIRTVRASHPPEYRRHALPDLCRAGLRRRSSCTFLPGATCVTPYRIARGPWIACGAVLPG